MNSRSGQPVLVSDVSLPTAEAQKSLSDLDRLVEYINERFNERDRELINRQRQASQLKLKGDLIALGFDAIDFRRELSGWVALARRLRDEHLAEALDTSYDERTSQAQAQDLKRANAELVKSRAKADVAPLNETIERLEAARDEMIGIISWCQSLQRAVRDEEFGDVFAGANEAPESMFSAPIGAALRKLQH